MTWMVEAGVSGSGRGRFERTRNSNPLTSATSCVRRWLRRHGYCMWLLLLLLVVGVSVQTFIIQPTSSPVVLRSVDHTFPPLQNFWSDLQSNSSPEVQQGPGPGEPQHRLQKPRKKPKQHFCRPKSHIFFLKTHKTGSSTVLNILYRYGEARNLTFALPRNKHNQLSYPRRFQARFVEGVQNGRQTGFHILCNHMRFNKSEVAGLMPKDTFYFSIVRHPVAMMDSLYTYYHGLSVFKESRSLEEMFNRSMSRAALANPYSHNNLAFDFGGPNNLTEDSPHLEAAANKAIAAIEEDFHLVLINEYFDQSMVLLRHALCWPLEDVVSFRLNSRANKSRKAVPPETAEKIQRWNALDWRIYLHFNRTFWEQVEQLVGLEEMEKEVAQLRELQGKLSALCLKGGGAVNPSKIKDARLKPYQSGGAVIQGYNLKPDLKNQTRTRCQRLITPELQYTNLLYDKQFP